MDIATLILLNGPIKLGQSGEGPRAVQLALKARGYPLNGTGYFGTATDTAVEAFQKRNGLTVDGVVGNRTAAALDAIIMPSLSTPAEKSEIARPLWLEAGLKLIGTHEGPGSKDNPVIIDWAKEEGGDIAAEYTHDSIPWCALFADHCLTKAGLKGPGTLWALDFAGKWPSIKLNGPAVGAFAPMLRSGGGHIIQVVGRDQYGHIMGLGGNQSDAVNIEPFPLSRLNKGFWWPASVSPPKLIGVNHLPVVKSDGKISVKES